MKFRDNWFSVLTRVFQAILAPMVRIGTLPMRLLSAQYGCRITYSEEIIDKKIQRAKRFENKENGTIDYLTDNTGMPCFVTVPGERVVFQIGTADANNALLAAQTIVKDGSACFAS